MSARLSLVALAVAAAALWPAPARAYLNPDQGSFLVQIVLGGLAGGAVMMRLYWRKLVALVARRPPADRAREG